MQKNNDIVIFETEDNQVKLPVTVEDETVWLNRNQMSELFDRDVKTIGKHINNALKEELSVDNSTVAKFATVQIEGEREVERNIEYYSLDVIISVGYRVKSKRGVEFRRWANSVLKQYILKGYAVNDSRIKQLGEVIRIMKRTENELDSKQVLSVIEKYSNALDLLDSYDHQNMTRP
ncbi:MAG: RhuM family protein, partial [Lachnospiraceae bacterium]|nr:RhuM family protein [Lachnospiraceae bacterium]